VPVPTDRNVASLRELYDKISTTIARFSFLRAVVFAIGAFTFASALNEISSSEVEQIVEELQKTFEITGTAPHFDDIFLTAIYPPSFFQKASSAPEEGQTGAREPADTASSESARNDEAWDRAIVAAKARESAGKEEARPEPTAADTANSENARKKEVTPEPTAAGTASAETARKRAVMEDEKNKATEKQKTLVDQLSKIAKDSFTLTFKAPLIGTDIKIDLRIWGFLLLPLVILAEVYLCVLRFKRKTIYTLASLVVKRDVSNATVADQLQFSQRNTSAFIRHPAQYEIAVSLIGAAVLAIYVAYAGAKFWQTWDTGTQVLLINAYAWIAIYAVAYVAYARRQLNKPVLIARGLNAPVGRSFRTARAFSASIRSIVRRIRPRLSLGTGGLMIISTLWLLVGATECAGPWTGLQYIKNPNGWWGGGDAFRNQIIRVLYLVGLLLAALSLFLVICSIFRSRALRRTRLTLILGDIAVAISLFFITDFSWGVVLADINPGSGWKKFDLGELSLSLVAIFLAIGLWIFPIWAWVRYRHQRYMNRSINRPARQRWLLRWYYPQIVIAAFFTCTGLIGPPRLFGVPVFILGIVILAGTYSVMATRETSIAHVFPKRFRKREASARINGPVGVEDGYQPTTVRRDRFTEWHRPSIEPGPSQLSNK